MNNRRFYFVLLFLFFGILVSNAQDPTRFKEQIEKLNTKEYNFKPGRKLVEMIQEDLPQTKVVLISAKPSVARWQYSKKYNRLNRKLKRLCRKTDNLEFADVWRPMLDENGQVFTDVFLDDNLHMNKKGYDIWGEVIGGFLK
jgi:lysophospholipase L1-like esterase